MAKGTHSAEEVFDRKGFISDVENAIEEILARPEDFSGDAYGFDEGYSYYILDVASSSDGRYQAGVICNIFNVEIEEVLTDEELQAYEAKARKSGDHNYVAAISDSEFAWDFIDYELMPPIEEELNSWLQEAGLPGSVSFGHLEADGSYGLFYHMDDDEFEDYLDSQEEGEDEYGRTAADRRSTQRFMKDQPGLPFGEDEEE